MTLKPAALSDQATLFDMHVEVFREHIDKIWGWDEEWQITNFQKEWGEVVTELIEAGGELLGYIQTRHEPDHIYILNLALYPKHQNQGLGARTMNTLKKRAEAQSLPMELCVFRTNQRAITFYERLGFEIYGKTETGSKMRWSAEALPEKQPGERLN